MGEYQIPLSGLSCCKCVKKLEGALSELDGTEIQSISKESVTLTSVQSVETLFNTISSLNYQPGNTVELSLSGLGCGKCVAKVNAAFSERDNVVRLEVSKEHLSLYGLISKQQAIDIVEGLGYQAKDATEAETPSKPEEEPEQKIKEQQNSSSQQVSVNLLLEGMTCASCVASVEKACLASEGVARAQVNLAEQSAVVSLTSDKPDIVEGLIQSVQDAGYKARILDDASDQQSELQQQIEQQQKAYKQSAIAAIAVGGALMLWGLLGGNMMIKSPSDQFAWGIVGLVCLVLLATAGRSFYTNAWQSLLHRRATMDTLVALGTGSAWIYSALVVLAPDWFPESSRHVYFEASAMIIGLISLGHFIETKAKLKTTQSLQALIGLQPRSATLVEEGSEKDIAIENVQKGMLLRIKPGEKVPVDGLVTEGESYVDESMLTGEPIPKHKTPGQQVAAGTINSDGSLLITATGVGSHTMLARIINMVRQAQSSKPAIARLADSVSALFVPVVVLIALFAATIWFFVGPEPKVSYMLVVSTTVLVIACPCALGLATPLSVTAGVGKAAELGILIRDADVLQSASKIDTVVFDKTGTLTQGKPMVQNISLCSDMSESELLKYAISLESHSEHPLAKAICDYGKEKQLSAQKVVQFQNQRGKGISGLIDGRQIHIGSVNFIGQLGGEITSDMLQKPLENAWTPVVVQIEGEIAGIISIADPLKPEAKEAVTKLTKQGIEVILLTGDNHVVAQKIAAQAGITKVISEVLPDEKAQHIQELQAWGKNVAMVGDGINDAPALAQANIGIAMGSGSDVAIESAQMTLLNSSPVAVDSAIQLSKATVRNMKENLFGAFIYNSLGIPLAAGALYPLTGFLLSPVVAGAAMALSSITVVTNANRLRSFKIKDI
ncbi:heavy metal translocating P-type ATPase [Vibrio sp. JC009]|uniref:heavy metal translocating P-type ATPase n=1 Tax=Vibrio sp. JC009 TaxID=2912314 RepID=UPI0023B12099|nr:heavy metal translocating P-type ATPase [Vibrio sp. JC009]WED21125.1 heavy metal translocating P-type ATPase [Vibrio sp. JC009]